MDDQQQLESAYRIGGLLYKYVSKSITDDELTELYNWVYSSKENQNLFEEVVYSEEFQDSVRYVAEVDTGAAFLEIQEKIGQRKETPIVKMPTKRRQFLLVAAASVIALIGIGVIYFNIVQKANSKLALTTQKYDNEVLPGGNKALLTLANGKTIILDNALNGILTKQGNTNIVKSAGGLLTYSESIIQSSEFANYNTLSTPRGGQYQVDLPDGSKVWLNSSSTLRYPAAFVGKEREVELTGEAYFEIAKNSMKPFTVRVNDMKVRVLGTQFNIMAYSEEDAITTTLLTGSIKVDLGANVKLLIPGDQAKIAVDGKIKVFKEINAENAVAWKNGYFYFDKVDIKTVLRQIARWYDVEVEFEGPVSTQHFGGKIQRDLLLSQVLEILASSNIHFRVEGKKLTVLP